MSYGDATEGLTLDEKKNFKELKNRINNDYGPEIADDFRIRRFLRAREFDLKLAEDMLRKHIEWRKKYRIDTIVEEFKMPEVQQKYLDISIIGFDNDGCLLVYCSFGNIDFKGILKSVKKSEILRYVAYFLTRCEKLLDEQSKKLGRVIEQWTAIFNFENYSFSQAIHKPAIEILLEAFSMYEANCPERLKTAYAINASIVFNFLFNVIKPILTGRTLNKIKIFGKEGWKEEFAKITNPEELPAFLGGKKTDPDGNPMCFTMISHCGPIPKKYYFRSSERRLRGQNGVNKYYLNRMGKASIVFDVTEPRSYIEWEFETEDNDVAFGLFYKERDKNEENLRPLIGIQRVAANLHIETGLYLCEKVGIYILILDNSYSWLRQKLIFCRAYIVKPSGQKKCVTC